MNSTQNKDFGICLLELDPSNPFKGGELGQSIEMMQLLQLSFGAEQKINLMKESDMKRGIPGDCRLVFANYVALWAHEETFPYDLNYVSFASRKPPFLRNDWAFLDCFSPWVWFTLALAVVLVSAAFRLTFRKRVTSCGSLFHVATTLVGNAHDWRQKTRPQKLIVWFWVIGVAFLVLAYTSVLLSFLTAPKRERGVETLDDIVQGLRTGIVTATTLKGHGIGMMFSSKKGKLQYIGRYLRESRNEIDMGLGHPNLRENEVVIANQDALQTHFGGSRYTVSEEPIFNFWYVGVYNLKKKGARDQYGEEVNQRIHRIWAGGHMNHYYDRYWLGNVIYREMVEANLSADGSPVQPLGLRDLSGIFCCLLAGYLASAVVLAAEMLSAKVGRREGIEVVATQGEVKTRRSGEEDAGWNV